MSRMPVIAHALMVLTSLSSANFRLPAGESDLVTQKNGAREASYDLQSSLQENLQVPMTEVLPTPEKLVSQRHPSGGRSPSFSSSSPIVEESEEREPKVPPQEYVSWAHDDNIAAESARLPLILPSPSKFSDEPFTEAHISPPPARAGMPDPSMPYDYAESTFNDVDLAAYAGLLLPYHSIRNASESGNRSQSHLKTKAPMFGDRLVPKVINKERIKPIVPNSNAYQYEGEKTGGNKFDSSYIDYEDYNDYYNEADYDYNPPQDLTAPGAALFGTNGHDRSHQRLPSHWDKHHSRAEINPVKKPNLVRSYVPPSESLEYDQTGDLWPAGIVLGPPVTPHLQSLRPHATSDLSSTQTNEKNSTFSQSLRTSSNQSDARTSFPPAILPDVLQSHPSLSHSGALAAAPYYIRPDRDIGSQSDISPLVSHESPSGTPMKKSLSFPIPIPSFVRPKISTSVSPHHPVVPSNFPPFISIMIPSSNTSTLPAVSTTSPPLIPTSVSSSIFQDTAPRNSTAESSVANNSTSFPFSDPVQITSLTESSAGEDLHAKFISSSGANSQILSKANLENVKHFQHGVSASQHFEPAEDFASSDFPLPSDFQLRKSLTSGNSFKSVKETVTSSPSNFPNKDSSAGRGVSATSEDILISTPKSLIGVTIPSLPTTSENSFIFSNPTTSKSFLHPAVSTSAENFSDPDYLKFFEDSFTSAISENEKESFNLNTPITLKSAVNTSDSADPEDILTTDHNDVKSWGSRLETFKGAVASHDFEWGPLNGEDDDYAEYDVPAPPRANSDPVPLNSSGILPENTFDAPANFPSDFSFTDPIGVFSVHPTKNSSTFSSNMPPDGFVNLFSAGSSDISHPGNANIPSSSPTDGILNSPPNIPANGPVDFPPDSPDDLRFHNPIDISSTGPASVPALSSTGISFTGHKNAFTVPATVISNGSGNFKPNFPANINFENDTPLTGPDSPSSDIIFSSGPTDISFAESSDFDFKRLANIQPNAPTTIPTTGPIPSVSDDSNGLSLEDSFSIPIAGIDDFQFIDSVVIPTNPEPTGSANVPPIGPTTFEFTGPAYVSSNDFANLSASVVIPGNPESTGSANVPPIGPTTFEFTGPAYVSSNGFANLSSRGTPNFQLLDPTSTPPIAHVDIHSNSSDKTTSTFSANNHSEIPANNPANNPAKLSLSETGSSLFSGRENDDCIHNLPHNVHIQNLTSSGFIPHATLTPAKDISASAAPDALLSPRTMLPQYENLPPFIPSTDDASGFIPAFVEPAPTTPSITFDQFISPTPREAFVSPTTFANTLVLPTTFAPPSRIAYSTTSAPPIPTQVSFTVPEAERNHNEFLVILSNDTHSLILPQQNGKFSILLTGFKNEENTPLEFVGVKSPSLLPSQAEPQETNLDIVGNGARQLELAARIEQLLNDEYSRRDTEIPDKAHDSPIPHRSRESKVFLTNVISPDSEKDRAPSSQAFIEPAVVDSIDNKYHPPRVLGETWNDQQINYSSFKPRQVLSHSSSNNTSLLGFRNQQGNSFDDMFNSGKEVNHFAPINPQIGQNINGNEPLSMLKDNPISDANHELDLSQPTKTRLNIPVDSFATPSVWNASKDRGPVLFQFKDSKGLADSRRGTKKGGIPVQSPPSDELNGMRGGRGSTERRDNDNLTRFSQKGRGRPTVTQFQREINSGTDLTLEKITNTGSHVQHSIVHTKRPQDAIEATNAEGEKKYEDFRFNDSYIDAIILAIRRREQIGLQKSDGDLLYSGVTNAFSEEKERPSSKSSIYLNEPYTFASQSKPFTKASLKNSREAILSSEYFPTADSVPSVPGAHSTAGFLPFIPEAVPTPNSVFSSPEPHRPEMSNNELHSAKSDIATGLHHDRTANADTPSEYLPVVSALTLSPSRKDESLSRTAKLARTSDQAKGSSAFDPVVGGSGVPDQKQNIQGHSLYSFLLGQPHFTTTRPSTVQLFATRNQTSSSGGGLDRWVWKALPHRQKLRAARGGIQVLREIRESSLLNSTTLKNPLESQGTSSSHNQANKNTQLQGVQELKNGFSENVTLGNKEPVSDSFSNGSIDSNEFIQTSASSHTEKRWIWRRRDPKALSLSFHPRKSQPSASVRPSTASPRTPNHPPGRQITNSFSNWPRNFPFRPHRTFPPRGTHPQLKAT